MLDGDERAFEEFFDANFDRVFRFAARRVSDEATAEDIAQATLVAGIRKLHTWRGEAALFTWLCSICRREVTAHFERTKRTVARSLPEDDPLAAALLDQIAAGEWNPEEAAHHSEIARRVQLTLDYLPGRYGDLLEWKYLHGLTVIEIAERLGHSVKAVESMLTRARAAFREGFTSLSGSWEAP
jgi:RNA polymerase sigma-70 factor (ECF subfamily)